MTSYLLDLAARYPACGLEDVALPSAGPASSAFTERADSGIGRYVREVELLELLDGIFKTARRIARSQIERAEVAPAA